MAKPPPLTDDQKSRLSRLEPRLRACVRLADLDEANRIAASIQQLLRPTGHETRLLQAKNWLYETALEANNLTYAKLGFEGTLQKAAPQTRLHLEATALLAICYLREKNLPKARELLQQAVENINNIKSIQRRRQFHHRLLQRLEEESVLVGLMDDTGAQLDVEEVDAQSIRLVMSKSEDQILLEMGKAVPKSSLSLLEDIRNTYQRRLPAPDRGLLPPPLTEETKLELGKRAESALRRVAWRALCDPRNEIYQAWSNGLSVVYDKKYITAAIVASFGSLGITTTMLAASAVALAVKFGAQVFCEAYAPVGLMIQRQDKE